MRRLSQAVFALVLTAAATEAVAETLWSVWPGRVARLGLQTLRRAVGVWVFSISSGSSVSSPVSAMLIPTTLH